MTNSKDFKLIFKQEKNSQPVKIRENFSINSLLFFQKELPNELKEILSKLKIEKFDNKNNNLNISARDYTTKKLYIFKIIFLKNTKYKIFMN